MTNSFLTHQIHQMILNIGLGLILIEDLALAAFLKRYGLVGERIEGTPALHFVLIVELPIRQCAVVERGFFVRTVQNWVGLTHSGLSLSAWGTWPPYDLLYVKSC